jgi:hypothetical protein
MKRTLENKIGSGLGRALAILQLQSNGVVGLVPAYNARLLVGLRHIASGAGGWLIVLLVQLRERREASAGLTANAAKTDPA